MILYSSNHLQLLWISLAATSSFVAVVCVSVRKVLLISITSGKCGWMCFISGKVSCIVKRHLRNNLINYFGSERLCLCTWGSSLENIFSSTLLLYFSNLAFSICKLCNSVWGRGRIVHNVVAVKRGKGKGKEYVVSCVVWKCVSNMQSALRSGRNSPPVSTVIATNQRKSCDK